MFVNTQSAPAARSSEDQLRQCPRLMATDDSRTINISLLRLPPCLQESRAIVVPSMPNQTNNLFKTRHALRLYTPDKGSQYEVQMSDESPPLLIRKQNGVSTPSHLLFSTVSIPVLSKCSTKTRNECHPL